MVNILQPVVEVPSQNSKKTTTIVENIAEKEKTTVTLNEVQGEKKKIPTPEVKQLEEKQTKID